MTKETTNNNQSVQNELEKPTTETVSVKDTDTKANATPVSNETIKKPITENVPIEEKEEEIVVEKSEDVKEDSLLPDTDVNPVSAKKENEKTTAAPKEKMQKQTIEKKEETSEIPQNTSNTDSQYKQSPNPKITTINALLPLENSEERVNEVTHVVTHFMSNAATIQKIHISLRIYGKFSLIMVFLLITLLAVKEKFIN